MTYRLAETEIQRWLRQATRGLPGALAARISAELRAHYEDALDDLLSSGMPPALAQREALVALGSAQQVRRLFWQTHGARARYVRAGVACLLPYMGMLATVMVSHSLTLVLLGLLTCLCTLYLLDTLRRLVGTLLHNPLLESGVRLAGSSLLLLTGVISVLLLNPQAGAIAILVNDPVFVYKVDYPFAPTATMTLLYGLYVGGAALLGAGWLLLSGGLAAAAAQDTLPLPRLTRRLLAPLRLVFLVSGFCLLLQAAGVLFSHTTGLMIGASVTGIVGTLKFALCAYVFFKLAYRGAQTPAQAA